MTNPKNPTSKPVREWARLDSPGVWSKPAEPAAPAEEAATAEADRLVRWAQYVAAKTTIIGMNGQPRTYDSRTPPEWFE